MAAPGKALAVIAERVGEQFARQPGTAVASPVYDIRPMRSADIPALARLHYDLIGRTGTGSIAGLGIRFLERVFYGGNLANPHFFCDVAADDGGDLVGLSVYTDARARLLCWRMAAGTAAFAATHPTALPTLLRTFRGEHAPAAIERIPGQWIVLAIDPAHRSRGIADRFVELLENRLRQRNCPAWMAAVRRDPPINRLLQRYEAKFAGVGATQGTMFNYYAKHLDVYT